MISFYDDVVQDDGSLENTGLFIYWPMGVFAVGICLISLAVLKWMKVKSFGSFLAGDP